MKKMKVLKFYVAAAIHSEGFTLIYEKVLNRVATDLENMENLINCQNLRENSGKWHNRGRKCIPANYSLRNCSGKSLKMTRKSQRI